MQRCTLPILALALLAAATPAQLTEKEATKQLTKALKAELSEVSDSVAEDKATALADLKAFTDAVGDGLMSVALAEDLFDDINDFLVQMAHIRLNADGDLALAVEPILASLAAGSDLHGLFPAEFYPGNDSAVDDFIADVDARVDKATATVLKKLRKAAATVEKKTSFTLSVASSPSGQKMLAVRWDEVLGASGVSPIELTIDLAMSVNDTTIEEDAVILVAGTGNDGNDLSVNLSFIENVQVDFNNTLRWTARFDDEGAGIPEGVYWVQVSQSSDPPQSAAILIGVR